MRLKASALLLYDFLLKIKTSSSTKTPSRSVLPNKNIMCATNVSYEYNFKFSSRNIKSKKKQVSPFIKQTMVSCKVSRGGMA